MTLPLTTSSSEEEDNWTSHSLKNKRKIRKSTYFDKKKESNETKEPLIPTFMKQSEYNPFSSSEEEEFNINEKLFRNKPNKKSEKHKCRLVIALVLCGLLFLSVVITIISIEILAKKQKVEDGVSNSTDIAANATSTITTLFDEENIVSFVDSNTSTSTSAPSTDETASTSAPSTETASTTIIMKDNEEVVDKDNQEDATEYEYDYYSPSSSLLYS